MSSLYSTLQRTKLSRRFFISFSFYKTKQKTIATPAECGRLRTGVSKPTRMRYKGALAFWTKKENKPIIMSSLLFNYDSFVFYFAPCEGPHDIMKYCTLIGSRDMHCPLWGATAWWSLVVDTRENTTNFISTAWLALPKMFIKLRDTKHTHPTAIVKESCITLVFRACSLLKTLGGMYEIIKKNEKEKCTA